MGGELFRNKYRVDSARLGSWDYTSSGYYFVTICTKGRECFFGRVKKYKMCLSDMGVISRIFLLDIPNHFCHVVIDCFIVMHNHVHMVVFIDHGDAMNGGGCMDCLEYYYGNDRRDGVTPRLNLNKRVDVWDRMIGDGVGNNVGNNVGDGAIGVDDGVGDGGGIGVVDRDDGGGGIGVGDGVIPRLYRRRFCQSPLPKRGSLSVIVGWYKSAVTKKINKIYDSEYHINFGWQPRFHDHIIRNETSLWYIRNYIKNNPKKWDQDLFYN